LIEHGLTSAPTQYETFEF